MYVLQIQRPICVAALLAGFACAEAPSLEQRFRDPPPSAPGPIVTLALNAAGGDTNETVSRGLDRIREMGAGGVLLSLSVAGENDWRLIAQIGERCRRLGLELGICDFFTPSAEPAARKLVWLLRQAEGAPATNRLPLMCESSGSYREVARLAVPATDPVLSHHVVDLAKGPLPAEGLWRLLWFGSVEVAPPVVDTYEEASVFRHVNQALFSLQGRLDKNYGTTLIWFQCAGAGRGELAWPRDMEALFLKRSGLGLARHLPALAGIPVGGETTAAHVRRHVAQTLREAWRTRYAANVRDLVQEAGLEAGIAVEETPVEPEEVALFFKRPTFSVARHAEERMTNVRAAGAARTLARRSVVGRLNVAAVRETAASPLLAFPYKHEMDGLYGDGATRVLLEAPTGTWLSERGFAQGRQACRYAQRFQLMLQHGEPAAGYLVWARGPVGVLDGYTCDYACQEMLEAAAVRAGRLRFSSERTYGALVIAAEIVRDPEAERLARQLAAQGLAVWIAEDGQADAAALVAQMTAGEKRLCKALKDGTEAGALPDFVWQAEERGMRLRFLHRRAAEAEIYCVLNESAFGGPVSCTFRDTGKGIPERWDPLGGEVGVLQEVTKRPDGRLSVSLYLEPHDSCFVIFDR